MSQIKIYKNFSGGLSNLLTAGDVSITELTKAQNVSVHKKGRIVTQGGLIDHPEVTQAHTAKIAPGYGLEIFSSNYKKGSSAKDTGENWLILSDGDGALSDFYDRASDSFESNLLALGSIRIYNPTSGFTTTSVADFEGSTITLALGTPEFITSGTLKVGDIIGFIDQGGGPNDDLLLIIIALTDLVMTVRGFPLTDDNGGAGDAEYHVYPRHDYYIVNDGVRSSPGGGGTAVQPRQRRYVSRAQWPSIAEAETVTEWNDETVGIIPPAPTSGSTTNVDGDANSVATTGVGIEVGLTSNADSGEWLAGTYETAFSFIYDGNQESELLTIDNTHAIADNDSLDVTIIVDASTEYHGRLSGMRVYIRIQLSDDPWVLLVDCDVNKGARCTLSGTYTAWVDSATAGQSFASGMDSFKLNLETYETLTGRDPATPLVRFATTGEFWNTSVVANGRTFLGACKYTDETGVQQMHRDQVIFSQSFEYDTFPINNVLPIGQGDSGEVIRLEFFADRLLVFKQSNLYLINIASGNPAEWYPEAEHPFKGVSHKAAVFMTPLGPAWCNKQGIFLYDGQDVIPLNKDRIEPSTFEMIHQRFVEFDGVNDYIQIADNAALDHGLGDFTVIGKCRLNTRTSGLHMLYQHNTGGPPTLQIYVNNTTGDLDAFFRATGSGISFTANGTDIENGEWWTWAITFDRSGVATRYVLNAAATTAPSADGSTLDITGENGDFAPSADVFLSVSATNSIDGDIGETRVYNRLLSTSEILDFHNGGLVAVTDQWGSQTTLQTSTLVNSNYFHFDAFGSTGFHVIWDSGTERASTVDELTLVSGVTYRVSFTLASDSGQAPLLFLADRVNGSDIGSGSFQSTGGGNNVHDFLCTSTTTGIVQFSNTATAEYTLSNLKIVPTGAVAAWEQKNISNSLDDYKWDDSSSNNLHGLMIANPIMPDTWEDFWTDFSIMGYEPKTNQLIIMKDCVGVVGRGNNYTDAWFLDLDTGAHTTGKQTFAAGKRYSNFAIDWNNRLVIAEQTAITTIDIKQWSDEPIAQAAGLIIIRTRDEDFGTAAQKNILAIVIRLKASIAQTASIKYAVDGKDALNAFENTSIVADDDIAFASDWVRLIVKPAVGSPLTCFSIRLEITNPNSTAGTLDIDEIAYQYDIEQENVG